MILSALLFVIMATVTVQILLSALSEASCRVRICLVVVIVASYAVALASIFLITPLEGLSAAEVSFGVKTYSDMVLLSGPVSIGVLLILGAPILIKLPRTDSKNTRNQKVTACLCAATFCCGFAVALFVATCKL